MLSLLFCDNRHRRLISWEELRISVFSSIVCRIQACIRYQCFS